MAAEEENESKKENNSTNNNENSAKKWEDFYSTGNPPWCSGAPYSQIINNLDFLTRENKKFYYILELGNGSSHTLKYIGDTLGPEKCKILGVDISKINFERVQQVYPDMHFTDKIPLELTQPMTFLNYDLFKLPRPIFAHQFDIIIDVQCFHCFQTNEFVELSFANLKQGGYYFLMTGNANEPYVGPSLLTKKEIEDFFQLSTENPLFEVLKFEETRYDWTENYRKNVGYQPLGWLVILKKL